MYRRPLVPDEFAVPPRLAHPRFVLRALTIDDLVKDYDAVMTSIDHLKGLMDPHSDWPVGLTLAEDLIDLGWHQREFTLRHSFAYTVMAPDESLCLGCAYIYPSDRAGYDAMAFYWARASEIEAGLEDELGRVFVEWIAEAWPFGRVAYPGRTIGWKEWLALPATDS